MTQQQELTGKNNVDTSKQLTHISLCFGYGGIDLGLHRVFGERLRTVAVSEIEAFAVENALAKMEAGLLPPAPIWTDLRTFPWADFQGVTILSGGFPCQPFSAAGSRKADSDPRHLFPAILNGIRNAKPAIVFLENVEGIISAKLAGDDWRDPAGTPVLLHVLRELERVGYRATAGIFSASEVGAPHQRKRVFILAVSSSLGGAAGLPRSLAWDERLAGVADNGGGEGCGKLGDTLRPDGRIANTPEQAGADWRRETGNTSCHASVWPSRPGAPQHGWEPPRVVADSGRRQHDGREIGEGAVGTASGELGEADELLGNADPRRLASGIDAGSGTEADRGGQGDIEQADGGLGNAADEGPQGKSCGVMGRSEAFTKSQRPNGKGNIVRQVEWSLGGNVDELAAGLGFSELSSLRDSELDEIREWMVKCDNRTDELRLLGNGVCPPTATKAFVTLYNNLINNE